MITVEIFSQGEEVVSGHTVDTNAGWLSQQLLTLGFNVTRHTAVGDRLADLVALLKEISARADVCICSGGLGPTIDDLTATAVAEAFTLPLSFDADAMQQIQGYYQRKNKPMPESNRKQALLPEGSLRLDNDWGTAPGFAFKHGRCWFAFVPGVPLEMRHMFEDAIKPELTQRFSTEPQQLIAIRTIGIGESDIQQCLQDFTFPEGVELSFCAGVEDVQTKLLFPASFTKTEIKTISETTAAHIGDHVYAISGVTGQQSSIAQVVAELLEQHQLTMAAVESISHGQLAAKCRDYQCLQQSYFSNDLDQILQLFNLSVEPRSLQQMAEDIAHAMQCNSTTDLVIVQLYDRENEPINDRSTSVSVLTMLLTATGIEHHTSMVSGHLLRKQNQSALLALDFLRRYLQTL